MIATSLTNRLADPSLVREQALFAGEMPPEDVFRAAESGTEGDRPGQRFYAHLYVGLYHEAAGRKELAEEQLRKAAGLARYGGYMGDVARVHARLFDAPPPATPVTKDPQAP